jgi:anaerobic selenocysteine-containing dehydrogenase
LRPASWDDALDRIAGAIRRTQTVHGPDAVGAFGRGGLTNEKAYQFGKFVRVALRSSNIDYNGRFCMSAAAAAATRAFGVDRGLPFPFDDIPLADVVVLVGANPADTMPPAMRYVEEGRERGARHVVIDPRRTATAALAHTHLQPVPNTDLSLANGLLHIAIRENLVDEAYISARTNNFDAVRRAVRAYWPDRVERTTGIAVPDLYDLVRSLAAAPAAMILSRAARRGPPVLAHDGPRPRAVPVGHPDPAQPDAGRRRPPPVRRAAPRAGPRARDRRRRPGAAVHAAGQRRARRPPRSRHPPRHRVRPGSTGAAPRA